MRGEARLFFFAKRSFCLKPCLVLHERAEQEQPLIIFVMKPPLFCNFSFVNISVTHLLAGNVKVARRAGVDPLDQREEMSEEGLSFSSRKMSYLEESNQCSSSTGSTLG